MSRHEIELGNAAAYLADAVRTLCDGVSDAKGRLYAAAPAIGHAWGIIQELPDDVVPAEFKEQMESIMDRLTKRASHRRPAHSMDVKALGSAGATLFGMHKSTAKTIARDVRRAHEMLEHIISMRGK